MSHSAPKLILVSLLLMLGLSLTPTFAEGMRRNSASIRHSKLAKIEDVARAKEEGRQSEELVFLGTFGTKSFYLGGQVQRVDHFEAAYACRQEEMRLARFDSQDEVTFIFQRAPFPTEPGWTDGTIKDIPSSFAWNNGGDGVSGNLTYDLSPSHGLLLDIDNTEGTLFSASRYELACFYCYTESLQIGR